MASANLILGDCIEKMRKLPENSVDAMTLLPQRADKDYIDFESEYAFRFHFNRQADWGTVADFGGGVGQKTRKINNVVVIDLTAEIKSLEPFDDGHFDLIYCSGTLEHLDEPARYLKLFHRKLKAGGRLFLSQPLDKSVFESLESEENGHLYTWSAPQLNGLLRECGFEVESNTTKCFIGIPFLSRYLNRSMGFWELQHRIMKNTAARKFLYLLAQASCLVRETFILLGNGYYNQTLGVMEIWASRERKKED
jgi:SAM-dependent methyltransferase